jgi:hypothetical protein
MKRHIVAVSILVVAILFAPFGNDVNINVGVEFKHPVKAQTKATMEQKYDNKVMAMKFAKAGYDWDLRQRQCVYKLFTAESRFDHLAKNQQGSSAYGIAQMLKETSSDPAIQILKAYKYIKHRYDTPCRAWQHHVTRNWY